MYREQMYLPPTALLHGWMSCGYRTHEGGEPVALCWDQRSDLWDILVSVSPGRGAAYSAPTTTTSRSFLLSINVNGALWVSQYQCACTMWLARDSGAQTVTGAILPVT